MKDILKRYFNGQYKEGRTSYDHLSKFFGEKLKELPLINLTFDNYRECYQKLAFIFSGNGVIYGDCSKILNYKKTKDLTLNGKWAWEGKGNYYYINSYHTEEVIVKCVNRKYILQYRKLDLEQIKQEVSK